MLYIFRSVILNFIIGNYQFQKLVDWNYTTLYYKIFTQKSYNTYYTYQNI